MAQFPNATKAVAAALSDTVAQPSGPAESLWIGVGGTISFSPADESYPNNSAPTVATTVPAGLFPFKVARVNATGTAATGILFAY